MSAISKRTPERVANIIQALRSGLGRTAACKINGIAVHTFWEWTDADPELREKVLAAESAAEQDAIQKVIKEQYTEDVLNKIDRALRSGNTRFTAARAAGIPLSVFKIWMDLYPEFSAMVDKAEAWIESVNVQNILKAGSTGSWQASAWFLERRIPEHWGRVDRVELEVRRNQAEEAARELLSEGIYVTAEELLRDSDDAAKKALPPPGSSRAKKSG